MSRLSGSCAIDVGIAVCRLQTFARLARAGVSSPVIAQLPDLRTQQKAGVEVPLDDRLREMTLRLLDGQKQAQLQFDAMKDSHAKELSRVQTMLEQRYRTELSLKARAMVVMVTRVQAFT